MVMRACKDYYTLLCGCRTCSLSMSDTMPCSRVSSVWCCGSWSLKLFLKLLSASRSSWTSSACLKSTNTKSFFIIINSCELVWSTKRLFVDAKNNFALQMLCFVNQIHRGNTPLHTVVKQAFTYSAVKGFSFFKSWNYKIAWELTTQQSK